MHPTVATVMTRDPVTAEPGMTYKHLTELLATHRISAVPVVNRLGQPIGVVSEADLLHRIERRTGHGRPGWFSRHRTRDAWDKSHALLARELMTSPVRTITARTPLPAAATRLEESGLRRLYVVDEDGVLLGVLSRGDVLRVVRRPDIDIRTDIERDVLRGAMHADQRRARVAVEDGVVTLLGRLEFRSECERAEQLTAAVPGVVEVRNRLDFVWRDCAARAPGRAGLPG